jgi:hypothetical protein
MTPVFRLGVAVPLIGLLAWLSACASDPDSPLRSALLSSGAGGRVDLTQLRAPDAAPGDVYGSAVALSRDGNTLAVGADLKAAGRPADGVPAAGAVYVYTRTAQGWREQARLRANVPITGSGFGHSLSLSDDGSRLAVGAPFESRNRANNEAGADGDQGAVYVFGRSGSAWDLQSRLLACRARSFDWFGMSVSLSGRGDTVAVSAHRHDGGETSAALVDSGAVYVFGQGVSGWTEQALVEASHPQAGARLGTSVALSFDGLTLAAGASATGRGAVHVFRQEPSGWREQAIVTSAHATAQNPLGSQVLLSADGMTLAVGATAPDGTEARQRTAGSAYVFVNQDGQWRQRARLQASNADMGDAFGERLALSSDGGVLAVSAVYEASAAGGLNGDQGDNSAPWAGAVYLYAREGQRWSQTDYVKAGRTRAGDLFGSALALSGDGRQLAVGARLEDGTGTWSLWGLSLGGALQNSGAVHLYSRG